MTKNIKVIAFMFILCACFVAPDGISDQGMAAARQLQIEASKSRQETKKQGEVCLKLVHQKPNPNELHEWAKDLLANGVLIQSPVWNEVLDKDLNICALYQMQQEIIEQLVKSISQQDILFGCIKAELSEFHRSLTKLCEESFHNLGFVPKAKSQPLIKTMKRILIQREFQLGYIDASVPIVYWALLELQEKCIVTATIYVPTPSPESAFSTDRSAFDKRSLTPHASPATPARKKPSWSPVKPHRLDDQFSSVATLHSEPDRQAQPETFWRQATIALRDRLPPRRHPAVASQQSSSASKPLLTDSVTPAPDSASNPRYSDFLTPDKKIDIAAPGSHDAPLLSASKSPHTQPENQRPHAGGRFVASPVNQSGSGQPSAKKLKTQSVPGTPEPTRFSRRQSTPNVRAIVRATDQLAPQQPPSPHIGSVPPVHQQIYKEEGQAPNGVTHFELTNVGKPTPQTPQKVMQDTAHAQQTPLGSQPASSSIDAFTPGSAIDGMSPIPDNMSSGSDPTISPVASPVQHHNIGSPSGSEQSDQHHSLGMSILEVSPSYPNPDGEATSNASIIPEQTQTFELTPFNPIESDSRQPVTVQGDTPLSSPGLLSKSHKTPTPPIADHNKSTDIQDQEELKTIKRSLEDELDKIALSSSESSSSDKAPACPADTGITKLYLESFRALKAQSRRQYELKSRERKLEYLWSQTISFWSALTNPTDTETPSRIQSESQSDINSDNPASPTESEAGDSEQAMDFFYPTDDALDDEFHSHAFLPRAIPSTHIDAFSRSSTPGSIPVRINWNTPAQLQPNQPIFRHFIGGDKQYYIGSWIEYLLRSINAMHAWLKGGKYNL